MKGGFAAELESILVVKPSSFGDIVHTLPAVARLKAGWPKARLAWVVNSEWAPLLRGNPFVDEIVAFPRADFRGLRGGGRFLQWCKGTLVGRKPDVTIDFQGLLRSAWMSSASGAPRRVGMSDAREGARFFYDEIIPVPVSPLHSVERYFTVADEVLRRRGRETARDDATFPLPPGDPPEPGGNALPEHYVLMHPFARGKGKSLSIEQTQMLCRMIQPGRVVLVGRMNTTANPAWPENCLSLLNATSLMQLIWLMRRASSVITVDSGPSHLAAALGRPMVAIHTWSDPRKVGPYRQDALVWKNGRIVRFDQLGALSEEFFRQRETRISEEDLAAVARAITSF